MHFTDTGNKYLPEHINLSNIGSLLLNIRHLNIQYLKDGYVKMNTQYLKINIC